ncbi:DUF986 family protein [Shimwellia blattae]|uniref:UPF0266 membrane protein EBL_c17550 n=1 Tax=Shimwellia blattae (strain ATCC 29907 / DSM 4481 / JCM 1650 / NBRC 105725 / CDC 9005-74) TaxID=630626 RepID=I2B8J5_SHIBC|nr:DUF986 family protein [Shimwellia blattae]AFJ46849.1 conserved inner membrane protein [Shimwellia blattae DSM 4481 = NBRC 105725]GAB82991.1 hypothetical protein YobD [Shimwellia blattae DSM 4481 = NBRC 105725]VDY64333.1 Predicted membrane protein [Shimwellia blattae]VEC22452.1 Predicted membrane protein [Shimwellia blattae]
MTLTDAILALFVVLLLGWAIYDEIVQDKRHGPTLLRVPLLRRSPVDTVIFIFLVGIVLYNNITGHGAQLTTWLLCTLMVIAIYIGWIRQPKVLFKSRGLFFSGAWITYDRIKEMNLSEDGVLVMQLEQRRLLIRVKDIDNLEKIYKFLVTNQ